MYIRELKATKSRIWSSEEKVAEQTQEKKSDMVRSWYMLVGTGSGGAYASYNALLALWLEVFGYDAYVAKLYILLLIVGWPRE